MNFRNLTPFDALAYDGLDATDRKHQIVAMCVGYDLVPVDPEAPAGSLGSDTFNAELIEDQPLRVCLADEHWGEPGASSLLRESDLVPFKPRCDVLVLGQAHSVVPRQWFQARLQLSQGGRSLLDKRLNLTGPRWLVRREGVAAWLRESLNPSWAYSLTPPGRVSTVDLRYELAFGGACRLRGPVGGAQGDSGYLFDEVCYRNPVGTGWLVGGFLEALAQTPQGLASRLPAPQITLPGQDFRRFIQTRQRGELDAKGMAAVDYGMQPAGFGPLGKAWAPRLALAGTYGQPWLDERHPLLPRDFDFGYWNGAPADQQIAYPDLTQGMVLQTEGLRPGGGRMRCILPGHRAFVLLRFHDGLMLPHPMVVDTLSLETSPMPRLRVIWRVSLPTELTKAVRAMEARFELDPAQPLLKLAPRTCLEPSQP